MCETGSGHFEYRTHSDWQLLLLLLQGRSHIEAHGGTCILVFWHSS